MTTAKMLIERGCIEGEARCRAEGEAKALLKILERRGIVLSDLERERVRPCPTSDMLESCLDCVLTIATAEDLFG